MSRKNFGMEGSSGIKKEQQVWQISELIETRFFSLKIKKKVSLKKSKNLWDCQYMKMQHTQYDNYSIKVGGRTYVVGRLPPFA